MKQCCTCKWWVCHSFAEYAWSDVTVDAADVELSCGRRHYDVTKDGGEWSEDEVRKALAVGPACQDWRPLRIPGLAKTYLPNPWVDDWMTIYHQECLERPDAKLHAMKEAEIAGNPPSCLFWDCTDEGPTLKIRRS